jgi:hypothetical protein
MAELPSVRGLRSCGVRLARQLAGAAVACGPTCPTRRAAARPGAAPAWLPAPGAASVARAAPGAATRALARRAAPVRGCAVALTAEVCHAYGFPRDAFTNPLKGN